MLSWSIESWLGGNNTSSNPKTYIEIALEIKWWGNNSYVFVIHVQNFKKKSDWRWVFTPLFRGY